MGFLFHPQLHQSQAALLSEPDQEFQVSAERRKQRCLKVELAKTSTTFRHYIIINDVAWIWKLEFTERIQIPRFAGKISHMRSRLVPGLSTRETGYEAKASGSFLQEVSGNVRVKLPSPGIFAIQVTLFSLVRATVLSYATLVLDYHRHGLCRHLIVSDSYCCTLNKLYA